ncbi:MAG TPA: secretion system protein E [Desulfobulbus sp.]|nr:secretion system protein E [Desulfobulbus sp.]
MKTPRPATAQQSGQSPASKYGEVIRLLLHSQLLTRKQVEYAVRVNSKLQTRKPLLSVIRELGYVTDEQIHAAIRNNKTPFRIGDLLVELGLISEEDLRLALKMQAKEQPKARLGEVLVRNNFLDERKFISTLALQLGFVHVEPEFTDLDEKLIKKGPVNYYYSHAFLPVRREGDTVLVAFADPLDGHCQRAAQNIFKQKISVGIASRKSILTTIERLFPNFLPEEKSRGQGESVVDIVNSLLVDAIEAGNVSDIHIEPLSDRIRVRFRTDGVLVPFREYPIQLASSLTSRIKVLCKADIAEKRRHQDGRILFVHRNREMDLRVSFYVTVFGEKIVLRLLNRQNELLGIEDIGMQPRILKKFREEGLDRPSGVILVTGPTGSGKTTTVYSCINYLNNIETSIITAEDPVEYVIEGIAQCSIDPKINLTFEETLRSVVRQDPDVIVIGEIRDSFSAEIAVQAAMTGHKVLTTFHTEDSIGGLLRLLNMDIDAFLISSTVVCIIAQRLLRRVCPQCVMPYELRAGDYRRIGLNPSALSEGLFRKGRGCDHCRYTGYKGRVAVFEVLVLNEEVRNGLIQRLTSHQIRRISIESTGMLTLFEDGLYKAAQGITTVDEVIRSLPKFQKPRTLEQIQRLVGV